MDTHSEFAEALREAVIESMRQEFGPQPITVAVVQRPTYRNERIRDFNLWLQDNRKELDRYFHELTQAGQWDTQEGDIFSWAVMTHEIEMMNLGDPLQPTLSQSEPMRTV